MYASGEEACFEQAEQEAHGDQTSLVLYESLADSGDAPEKHDGRKPGRWRYFLQDDIAGHLEGTISDGETTWCPLDH